MAGITQTLLTNTAKILYVGDSGVGKTGSKASLICAGYKIRMADQDDGAKILYSLLTDPHYPYLDWVQRKGIDLDEALDVIPFDMEMHLTTVEQQVQLPDGTTKKSETSVLAPKSARGWTQLALRLNNWEGKGGIYTWDNQVVFDLDSFTTISDAAYFHFQAMNNRLGKSIVDNEYKRDVGSAQTQLRNLLMALKSKSVHCNCIVTGHIRYLDDESGWIQTPQQILGDTNTQRRPQPKGFLRSVGSALSPIAGIYFNDLYQLKLEGSRRTIYTIPMDNIAAKNSVWLERSYDISTGLAEIFARHLNKPEPRELIEALGKPTTSQGIGAAPSKPNTKPTISRPQPLRNITS